MLTRAHDSWSKSGADVVLPEPVSVANDILVVATRALALFPAAGPLTLLLTVTASDSVRRGDPHGESTVNPSATAARVAKPTMPAIIFEVALGVLCFFLPVCGPADQKSE